MINCLRPRSAYTLVEMLIVISVVAILGALLFPVFGIVREKARSANCGSNLRQLGPALQQYANDNGNLPFWYNEYSPSNPLPNKYPGLPWTIRIGSYVKNRAIFQCPSDKYPSSLNLNFVGFVNGESYTDYFYNTDLSGLTDSKITRPSEVVMLFDGGAGPAYNAQNSTPGTAPQNGEIHSGGANYAFADGHIKWYKLYGAINFFEAH